jgi:hypothetical protein
MARASGRRNLPREPRLPAGPANDAEGRQIGQSARQDPAGSPIPGLTGNIVNYETVRQRPAVPDQVFDEFRGMMAHGVPNASDVTEERALMERDGALARQHRPPAPPELHGDIELPAPVPVYITTLNAGGRPLGTISATRVTVPASTGNDPVRVAARDLDRTAMYLMVETAAGSVNAALTPPSVPATGVAAQNTNAFPVTVVISANGATITNVVVNGVSVGTAAGTYVVPAYGAISISYTVATPTWTWTGIGNGTAAPSGIRISREIAQLSAGFGALLRAGMSSYQRLENQQDELFALSNDGSACTLSMIFLYGEPAAG